MKLRQYSVVLSYFVGSGEKPRPNDPRVSITFSPVLAKSKDEAIKAVRAANDRGDPLCTDPSGFGVCVEARMIAFHYEAFAVKP